MNAGVASRIKGEKWTKDEESELCLSTMESPNRTLCQKKIFEDIKAAGFWEEGKKEEN